MYWNHIQIVVAIGEEDNRRLLMLKFIKRHFHTRHTAECPW
jgi:hypothetical protein